MSEILSEMLCHRCFKAHPPGLDCYPKGAGTVFDPDSVLPVVPHPDRPAEVTRSLARLAALNAVAREARTVYEADVVHAPAWARLGEALRDLDSLGVDPAPTPPVPMPRDAPPGLADRLAAMADSMAQFPWMTCDECEIALVREAAGEFRRLHEALSAEQQAAVDHFGRAQTMAAEVERLRAENDQLKAVPKNALWHNVRGYDGL